MLLDFETVPVNIEFQKQVNFSDLISEILFLLLQNQLAYFKIGRNSFSKQCDKPF